MYTSATKHPKNRQTAETALVYFGSALFCILFDRIYALFGHGVSSAAMTWMFLYPLLGGTLPFALLWLAGPGPYLDRCRRFSYNAYNSGLAALTIASALTGVFEIAGTSSVYTTVMAAVGWALCLLGAIGYGASCFRRSYSQP